MVDKLSTWLNSELKQRGWSHRELARRAGISGAMVSAVIAGDRNAGWGFCEAIAKPLGKAPIEVFRIAGLMPPEPTGYDEAGLLHRYRRLTPEQQRTVVAMLSGLAGQESPAGEEAQIRLGNGTTVTIKEIMDLVQRLDVNALQHVRDFACWVVEHDRPGEPEMSDKDQEWLEFLETLTPEKINQIMRNLYRLYGPGGSRTRRSLENRESGPDQEPRRANQGTLL